MSSVPATLSAKRHRGGSARYLRSHGPLLWRVTRNDMAQRHAGSMLGFGWVFVAPLLVLGIYSVIYLEIFRVKVVGLSSIEYVNYIFCGLVPYLAAAEAIGVGVSSVITNKSVLNNTVFPIDLAPVKPVLSSQAVMAVGMPIVVVGAIATGNLHKTMILLPVVWILNIVWLIGLNWLLSLLNVIFRDLQNLVTAFLMVMLVASPIAYTPNMVPATLKPLLELNPFAYFVVAYQQVIMLGIWPSSPHLAVLVVLSAVTFLAGSWFFYRAKRVIIDYV
ncbi:MAG TPA: ABC transporter permease [Gaiellaceae bacterium]|jgi:lipopolysaccharide transport system permease protein